MFFINYIANDAGVYQVFNASLVYFGPDEFLRPSTFSIIAAIFFFAVVSFFLRKEYG